MLTLTPDVLAVAITAVVELVMAQNAGVDDAAAELMVDEAAAFSAVDEAIPKSLVNSSVLVIDVAALENTAVLLLLEKEVIVEVGHRPPVCAP